jgi:hypothetical protein
VSEAARSLCIAYVDTRLPSARINLAIRDNHLGERDPGSPSQEGRPTANPIPGPPT